MNGSLTMTRREFVLLAAVCAVAPFRSSFAGIVLDAPGHVYEEGATLTVSNAPADSVWTLTDWLGRKCVATTPPSSCDGEGAIATQWGSLSAGYYHLKIGDDDVTFAVVPKLESRTFDRNSFYGVDSAQSWVSRKGRFLCPWYGGDTFRLVSDLIGLAGKVEQMVADYPLDIKVAVMGCVVNGPGEAKEADLGIAGGKGEGLLIKKGEIIRKVPEAELLSALKDELDHWEA